MPRQGSGRIPLLTGTRPPENGGEGEEKNFEVEPQGPIVDVFQVQPHPVLKVRNVTTTAYLPETGEPRTDA